MGNRRLLVVDDEPDLGAFVCDAARGLDYAATAVECADEFKRRFDSSVDVVVLDLTLPGSDGIELIRYLAHRDSRAAVIFMSGCHPRVMQSASSLAEAHGLKVIGAVGKPVQLEAIESLLRIQVTAAPDPQPLKHDSLPAAEFEAALADEQLVPHYQPKFDLQTRKLAGVEALARWQHPRLGILSPARFIPLAIETGTLGELTMTMLRQGVADLAQWDALGRRVETLAVNFDARQLQDVDLPDRVLEIARQRGITPGRLIVEVTESAMIDAGPEADETLTRLRLRGAGLSIDDFGTGHATMRQLERFPFSELKIDRSFIGRIGRNEHTAAITQSMVELAHKLGMTVVAEGVETYQQLEMLRSMGCNKVQGFLFAHPLPAGEIQRRLGSDGFWHCI